jgi:hypothetical protein
LGALTLERSEAASIDRLAQNGHFGRQVLRHGHQFRSMAR